jgi:large subunit ribosomal protein L9
MLKLLLQADVPALGKIGDVVSVNEGFARNFLLPQRLAIQPTPKNIAIVEEQKKIVEAKRAHELAEKKAMAERLNGVEVTIISTCNEQGVLFGSVGPKEIADSLKTEGYNVDAKHVVLPEHIKQVNKYTVKLELAPDVTCEIGVWVAPSKDSVVNIPVQAEAQSSENGTTN